MRGTLRPRFGSGAKLLATTLLGVGLLGLLAACGASAPQESAPQPEAATPTAITVVVAPSAPVVTETTGGGATPTPTPVGERPEYGGTLRFASASLPFAVDPYGIPFTYSFSPVHWNSLVQQQFPYDPAKGVQFEPHLATEYAQSADGSKWRFKLRQGVTWHDGEVFNADDVVATVQRLLDRDFLVHARQVPMRNIWVGAKKIDDYTVELDTGVANSTALSYIVSHLFPMMPEHLIRGVDPTSNDVKKRWKSLHPDKAEDKSGTLGIGTGPFKMAKWEPEVEWVGERNSNYFKFDDFGNRLPYLDRYVRQSIPDGTRRLAVFVSGSDGYSGGQGSGLHPDKAKALCSQTRDRRCFVQDYPHGYFAWFPNFVSTPAFTDGRMKAAARYSQDMDDILRLSYGGRQGFMVMDRGRFPDTALTQKEQYEVIPWSNPARREEFKQKAKDLVEAGFPKGLDLPFPIFSNGLCSGSFLDEYSRHVDQFGQAGIRGFLECRQGLVLNDELKAGRWSMNGPGGSIFLIDPGYSLILWHLLDSSPIGTSTWRHPGMEEIDAKFRKLQKTPDEKVRNELSKDIERYMANPELATFPTGYTVVHMSVHGCVRNFRPGGTWDSHQWAHDRTWLEKECR